MSKDVALPAGPPIPRLQAVSQLFYRPFAFCRWREFAVQYSLSNCWRCDKTAKRGGKNAD